MSEPSNPDRARLRAALVAALDEAHRTHPCPVTGRPYWVGCVHPDGGVGSCHSGRRADAVLAVLNTEEKASAPAPTATPQPEAEPVPLRWGLDDVMYGDDDTTILLLSGPEREPYVLELDPERTAALRDSLAGPDQPDPLTEGQQQLLSHIYADGGRCSTGCAEKHRRDLDHPFHNRRSGARDDLHILRDNGFLTEHGPVDGRYYAVACPDCGSVEGVLCASHPGTRYNARKDGAR